MNDKKNERTLSWDEFQSIGNPGPEPESKKRESESSYMPKIHQQIRIYLERKGRKGKTVTVIKGLREPDTVFETFARELKNLCGTGGTIKDETILLQGNHLQVVREYLLLKGYEDTKIAGGA